ncbi:TPA: hypothetical protein DCZ39_07550 [Patescibacteria group bacterium]|nr:hypothetical protein [Candidatus Gracilibacteria bacterium]
MDRFGNDKLILDANLIKPFQFELTELNSEVIDMINTEERERETGTTHTSENRYLSDKGE